MIQFPNPRGIRLDVFCESYFHHHHRAQFWKYLSICMDEIDHTITIYRCAKDDFGLYEKGETMDFLSGIFQPIVDLMSTLVTYAFQLTQMIGYPSYGVAIILLTIVIKAILAPLTVKQIKSMKAMQELQPRMKQLQDKYKNDPAKLQAEMGALYKEMGVNPLAGCLPLLVQMPFLIAIYWALKDYPYDPNFVQFLWLPSLGDPDPMYILPILSALSTWVMSRQTSNGATGAAAQQQKIMTIFMPLFIGYISLSFPSGLVIYWVVSNVFQLIQQHFIYKNLNAK